MWQHEGNVTAIHLQGSVVTYNHGQKLYGQLLKMAL